MMGIGNEAGTGSEERERLNFQVSRLLVDLLFVERNETIILLIDIKELNDPFLNQVFVTEETGLEGLHVLEREAGVSVFTDDVGTTESPPVTGDVDSPLLQISVDGDVTGGHALSSQLPEGGDEALVILNNPNNPTIEEDHEDVWGVELLTRNDPGPLNPKTKEEVDERSLLIVRRDVSHESQILYESTGLCNSK
jgi:hypothetical protein